MLLRLFPYKCLFITGLPNELGVFWQQYPWVLGETVCKLRALLSEMSSYSSVLTIVAFSTERYLAICQPIHSYTTSSPRIALRVIAILWCIALLSATPFAVFTKVNYVDFPPGSNNRLPESAYCGMLDHNVPSKWLLCELSAFLFFLGPMLIIVVLYVRMGLTIRSRMIKFPGETKHLDSRTKPIIRMLAAVVVAFFLCWAPFHMQRLFYIYGKRLPEMTFQYINELAYYITGCFYFFSCTVNPVLYNVMSAKYRLAFRKTLCCRSGDGANREASTFRDTTVVYVNSDLERCRSINNHGEVRRLRSISRYSKNSDVPNNMVEKTTHNILQNSPQGGEKGLKWGSDEVSDMIVMVKPSSSAKTWSKALIRAPKKTTPEQHNGLAEASEPCLQKDQDNAAQEETPI
ncbi:neuropeptides capa receptor-like [Periplaneta americana]|uniref:neuropeptides capa receptor-like n=1 Tax=Periplaneta americana TaxID=6978 RepID=UPI0037E74629